MKIFYKRKLLIVSLMLFFALILFQVTVYATDSSFTLNKESVDIALNGTAFISYSGGTETEIVNWESSDESVATVHNGTVSALKIGTTTITATRGEESATCVVNVIYGGITIGGNTSYTISSVNLVLDEHPTENLYATVEDSFFEVISDAKVTWSSSEPSIVSVNETGTIKALKEGTAIITATAAGVTDTCEVTVVNGPKFTDFSNANYELLFDVSVDLKITGITPNDENKYYYIITDTNTKPTIFKTPYGAFDDSTTDTANRLSVNTTQNYLYDLNLDKYVELNQDFYLWVIESVELDAAYALDEDNYYISYSSKFVVEGEKLTRPKLPQLNLILQSFSIWGGENSSNIDDYSSIYFRFPAAVENRKFKLKIGKVTDNSILQKIKNEDYSGMTDLLTYAKNSETIYSADLTTTRAGVYSNNKALFDGISLLQDKAYYFVYAEFDDENGKYYPIECVTLAQAWIGSTGKYWNLYAYATDNFEWNNLTGTPIESEKNDESKEEKEPDDTLATENLPNTGTTVIILVSTLLIFSIGTIVYIRYKNLSKYVK